MENTNSGDASEITEIIQHWSSVSDDAKGRVVAALYEQLRRNAASHLRGESHVDLQPTSLVHEAYDRLVNVSRIDLHSRSHFLGLAGRIMRQVLVDEARRRRAQKRDVGLQTQFTERYFGEQVQFTDILELEEMLQALEEIDPQYVLLFEARAFAGMTVEETAASLGMSPSTVKRRWKVVLAWLRVRLDAQQSGRSDS